MFENVLALLVACLVVSSCGPRETPAQHELRQRLRQDTQMSSEELGRFRAEITQAMAGRDFLRQGSTPPELSADEHAEIFGMFIEPAGMFDEGMKKQGDKIFRVLNSPATSTDAEVESFRRLWIDVDTFLPHRFELAHSVGGYETAAFDLVPGPKK